MTGETKPGSTGDLEGGCDCGSLRYRLTGEPYDSGYCHCRICQRTSGAPAQAFARYHAADFAYIKGKPKIYLSSDWGQREYCPDCGSQLLYRGREAPFDVAVNTPTLDNPEAIPPRQHVWHRSRIGWYQIGDKLPCSE